MNRKSVTDAYKSVNIGSSIGGVTIDSNYYIVIADIAFHSFLWENTYFPIIEIISGEDVEEFKNMLNDVTEDNPQEMFLMIRGNDGIYIPAFVTAKISSYNLNNDVNYDLEFSNAINAARNIKEYKLLTKKLKEVVGLCGYVLFEYDVKTTEFKIYYEVNGNNNIIYEGLFSAFKDEVIENGLVEGECIAAFNDFCSDIEKCKNHFNYALKCSFIPGVSPKNYVNIKGAAVSQDLDALAVVGIMSTDNEIGMQNGDIFDNKADIDGLTGILNKRAITQYAEDRIKNSNGDILITILDIDYFKQINDSYGHLMGDEVLSVIAAVIKNAVNGCGVPGRIGGDEFFIVFYNIDSENQLRIILREISRRIEIECKKKNPNLKVTCTMGIAKYPQDAKDFETLFKIADKALYIGKVKGRNRFIIYRKELHGTLNESDKENTNIRFEKTPLCKRQAASAAIDLFVQSNNNDFNSVLKAVQENYNLDDIRIYVGEDLKLMYSAAEIEGLCDDGIKALIDIADEGYYTDENIFVVDNYNIFEYRNKSFFEFMKNNNVFSIISYIIKDENKIIGLIGCFMIGNLRKWSEWDINMLALICKLIGEKIKRFNCGKEKNNAAEGSKIMQ